MTRRNFCEDQCRIAIPPALTTGTPATLHLMSGTDCWLWGVLNVHAPSIKKKLEQQQKESMGVYKELWQLVIQPIQYVNNSH